MHGLDLMLHGPLVRTFLRYCIPWTLAMLLQSSAAIVDLSLIHISEPTRRS